MDEGTPERTLANWLMEQSKRDLFRLTPESVEGLADFDELRGAVRALVARGYLEVTREPIGSIYVAPTELGLKVFWGSVRVGF